jgi:hypothetical protein
MTMRQMGVPIPDREAHDRHEPIELKDLADEKTNEELDAAKTISPAAKPR